MCGVTKIEIKPQQQLYNRPLVFLSLNVWHDQIQIDRKRQQQLYNRRSKTPDIADSSSVYSRATKTRCVCAYIYTLPLHDVVTRKTEWRLGGCRWCEVGLGVPNVRRDCNKHAHVRTYYERSEFFYNFWRRQFFLGSIFRAVRNKKRFFCDRYYIYDRALCLRPTAIFDAHIWRQVASIMEREFDASAMLSVLRTKKNRLCLFLLYNKKQHNLSHRFYKTKLLEIRVVGFWDVYAAFKVKGFCCCYKCVGPILSSQNSRNGEILCVTMTSLLR